MKKSLVIIVAISFAAFLFTNCSNKKSESLLNKESDSIGIKVSGVKKDARIQQTNFDLLQGKWHNTIDKEQYMVIDKNHMKFIYEGVTEIDDYVFTLSERPMSDRYKGFECKTEKDKYISCKEADMCYYIVNLTSEKLILSIPGTGDENNLKYEKVSSSKNDSELSEYDKQIIGTWSGSLSGSNLTTKKLVVVFTKSSFNQQKNFGNVEGYSTVNGTNKTFFTGTYYCDADTPVLELNESKSSGTNGTFKISSLTCDGDMNGSKMCGTWSSYNGQLQREVSLSKK